MNIAIIRTFVPLRLLMDLAREIEAVFALCIEQLITTGFRAEEVSIALHHTSPYSLPERSNMADPEKKIQELESQFPSLSGVTFAAARKEILASGQSVLQSENGVIYEVFPDGTRKLIKEIEPPTPVVPGTKITIR